MQQTETLKLNIIEGSDTVDPAPINENFRTMERELSAIAADVGSGGKDCRLAYGTYIGTGTYGEDAPQVFDLDFKPVLFYLTRDIGGGHCHILRPATAISGGQYSDSLVVTWGDRSLSFYSTADSGSAPTYQYNFKGTTYCYLILGVDE